MGALRWAPYAVRFAIEHAVLTPLTDRQWVAFSRARCFARGWDR